MGFIEIKKERRVYRGNRAGGPDCNRQVLPPAVQLDLVSLRIRSGEQNILRAGGRS